MKSDDRKTLSPSRTCNGEMASSSNSIGRSDLVKIYGNKLYFVILVLNDRDQVYQMNVFKTELTL